MSAYIIVQIDIRDPATYERYKELAPPSIAAFNGRYVARGGRTVTLEGDWQPARVVILEFPDLQQAQAWWASPEYAEAKALRQQAASAQMIAVEGLAGS
jgi:uncharacterized protein (DUF1330 family)